MKIFIIGGLVHSDRRSEEELKLIKQVFSEFAEKAQLTGHDIIVCSSFKDSADYFAIIGAANSKINETSTIGHLEIHYPDNPGVDKEVRELFLNLPITSSRIRLFSHLST